MNWGGAVSVWCGLEERTLCRHLATFCVAEECRGGEDILSLLEEQRVSNGESRLFHLVALVSMKFSTASTASAYLKIKSILLSFLRNTSVALLYSFSLRFRSISKSFSIKSLASLPVTQFERQTEITSTPAVVPETPIPILFKANFSRLPVWDFEDVYNQDAPPGNRRCPQSLRNSKHESFKKAFLPNVRLFVHKDSINMSEWNRLSHFNNPFGFMGYTYDDVMSAVKLIPKPQEPLLSPKVGGDGCIRCAVVGNAGILNGSNMGEEIDAHDHVFRMNGAVVQGYEEDVGNKTTVYVHTAHSITTSLYLFKKYGYKSAPHDAGIKYVMIPEGMRDFQWLQGLLRGQRVEFGPYKNQR